MKLLRKRLTYANVMSSIAVFLVVAGGSALAANQLGKNTVGATQLKKNAVTAAKIKNGAVTGAKLNLSTLGTVPSATTAKTATTATNATNAVTATNAKTAETAKTATTANTANTATTATTSTTSTKANQLSRLTVVKVDFTVATGAGSNTTETASCPAGTQAIGGGARNDAVSNNGAIITSRPVVGASGAPGTGESFDGWRASITNTAVGVLNSSVWAICAG